MTTNLALASRSSVSSSSPPDASSIDQEVRAALAAQPWVTGVTLRDQAPPAHAQQLARAVRTWSGESRWLTVFWEGHDPVRAALVAAVLDRVLAESRVERLEDERVALLERLELIQSRLIERSRVEALGTLAASIVHDLRSPLTALVTGIDFLHDYLEGHPDADGILGALFEDNRLALESIEGLLAGLGSFTGQHAARGPVPLRRVVESALQLTRWCMRRKSVEVSVVVEGEPHAFATLGELVQIVVNLVTNAVDEVPRGSTLHVRAARDERARIWVADEGGGVPENLARAIFEPFHTSKAQGMGLGLAIAREMARRQEGDLYVSYERPPELPHTSGACFVLELPGA